jgi:hypothetical protein
MGLSENFPDSHELHSDELALAYCPSVQFVHDPLPPSEYDHEGHVPHTADPAGANIPATHTAHVAADTAPKSADAVPLGHRVHAVALAPAHCPPGHCSHVNAVLSSANFL